MNLVKNAMVAVAFCVTNVRGAEIVSFAGVAMVRGLHAARGARGQADTVGRSAQRAMQRAWSCVGDVGETDASDERH